MIDDLTKATKNLEAAEERLSTALAVLADIYREWDALQMAAGSGVADAGVAQRGRDLRQLRSKAASEHVDALVGLDFARAELEIETRAGLDNPSEAP